MYVLNLMTFKYQSTEYEPIRGAAQSNRKVQVEERERWMEWNGGSGNRGRVR